MGHLDDLQARPFFSGSGSLLVRFVLCVICFGTFVVSFRPLRIFCPFASDSRSLPISSLAIGSLTGLLRLRGAGGLVFFALRGASSVPVTSDSAAIARSLMNTTTPAVRKAAMQMVIQSISPLLRWPLALPWPLPACC